MNRFLTMLVVALLAVSILGACGEKTGDASFEKIETIADNAPVDNAEETKDQAAMEETKTDEPAPQKEPEPKPADEPVVQSTNEWFTSVVSAAAMSQTQASLTWSNANGNVVSFKEAGGRLYLIDVWAQWCPPCRMSTPTMIELYKKYRDSGLVVIGLNTDTNENLFKAQEYAQAEGITYPVLHDPQSSKVRGIFVGQGIPAFTLVDSEGTVLFTNEGAIAPGTPEASNLESLIRTKLGL